MSTVIPFIAEDKISIIGIKSLFKNPLFVSFLFALILNLCRISTLFTDQLLSIISEGIVFLGLIIVGLNLEIHLDQWGRSLLLIFIKTLLGLSLAILLASIFKLTGLEKTILIIASILPPSLMAMIFAEKYNLDKRLTANTLTLALPLSIIFITFASMIF